MADDQQDAGHAIVCSTSAHLGRFSTLWPPAQMKVIVGLEHELGMVTLLYLPMWFFQVSCRQSTTSSDKEVRRLTFPASTICSCRGVHN